MVTIASVLGVAGAGEGAGAGGETRGVVVTRVLATGARVHRQTRGVGPVHAVALHITVVTRIPCYVIVTSSQAHVYPPSRLTHVPWSRVQWWPRGPPTLEHSSTSSQCVPLPWAHYYQLVTGKVSSLVSSAI